MLYNTQICILIIYCRSKLEEIKVMNAKVDHFKPSEDEVNRFNEYENENSVYCKLCEQRHTDFTNIWYLQMCLHPFCKKKLKELIFK